LNVALINFLINKMNSLETRLFTLLFVLAVTILLVVFLLNLFSNTSGTYVNHTNMMWDLFRKKYNNSDNIAKKNQPFESKGELECRRAIESLTGKSFPKARPSFMRNNVSGQNLELDCYCDELKTAVEYNGQQHYKYIPYFHHNKEAFYNTKYRDEMKKRLCDENNVKLIIVPYTVSNDKIESFIQKELRNFSE